MAKKLSSLAAMLSFIFITYLVVGCHSLRQKHVPSRLSAFPKAAAGSKRSPNPTWGFNGRLDTDEVEIDIIKIKGPSHESKPGEGGKEQSPTGTWLNERFFDILLGPNAQVDSSVTSPDITKVKPKSEPASNSQSRDCPTCTRRKSSQSQEVVEAIHERRALDLIKRKLRLDSRTTTESAEVKAGGQQEIKLPPEALSHVAQDGEQLNEDDFHARDVQEIVTGVDIGRGCLHMHSTGCFDFRLSKKVQANVVSAQLWIYKTRDRHDNRGQTLRVYGLRMSGSRLQRHKLLSRVDTFAAEDWLAFDITTEVQGWMTRKNRRGMIAINCQTCYRKSHRVIYGEKRGYKPVVVISLSPIHSPRPKRSVETCDYRTNCCKYSLPVNLASLNMYLTFASTTLEVGYCYGSCQDRTRGTYNHTNIAQALIGNDIINVETYPGIEPCCVPTRLSNASVMVYENGYTVTKRLTNIRVVTCGCV